MPNRCRTVFQPHRSGARPVISARAMASTVEPLRNVLAQSKSPYLLQHKDNPVAVCSMLLIYLGTEGD